MTKLSLLGWLPILAACIDSADLVDPVVPSFHEVEPPKEPLTTSAGSIGSIEVSATPSSSTRDTASLSLEYRLKPSASDAWTSYATATLEIPKAVADFGYEVAPAKVVTTLEGNAYTMAEALYDHYRPSEHRVLQYQITVANSSSIASIPLSKVKSERQLARILSNLEVHLMFNDKAYLSGNVRVPWEVLAEADISSKRVGTVYMVKPLRAPRVIEEPPKPPRRQTTDDSRAPPPPQQQSFFRKYWWALMLAYFAMNMLGGAQQAQQQSSQAAAGTAGGNNRH
eukprot:Protomagalhaensia_wolfi_Nauph_80__861@NODE_1499_length_1499_cov_342_861644_g400_i2_p1_GENE_NODE_1499_length_1499_cov_342_861644_g400_i2NODE_1499_length_1499_cov_342_861644_g400_i2_p1_ORF_typecomplete_len283_score51_64DUF4054/PF13262_6/5_8e02DUF4054/PF13262_6/1_1e03DUF4054/PF13262_6/0_71_NODE_1499_length_1499_cov_342_861644_g400_i246894